MIQFDTICWTTGDPQMRTEQHSKLHLVADGENKTLCGLRLPDYCDNWQDSGLCRTCRKIASKMD